MIVRDSSAVRLAEAMGRQSTLQKENSGFATPTLGWHTSTFRGYQILFSIRNPYINRFTNHFCIHSQPSYPQKVGCSGRSNRLIKKKSCRISVVFIYFNLDTAYLFSRNLAIIPVKSLIFGGTDMRQSFKLALSEDSRQLQSYTIRIGVVSESFLTA